MKNRLLFFIAVFAVSGVFHSCQEEEQSFDETLLFGKWRELGKEMYYKYLPDYTGSTWDESEDVQEDEAQEFTWSLVKSKFTHLHQMEMGGVVPKRYTVTELTATSLKYEDDFNKSFSFVKTN